MKITAIPLKQKMVLILLSTLTFNQAIAKSGVEVSGKDQADSQQHKDHSNDNQQYRGVFYGFLPCKDCAGTKTTMSLKNRNNYLIVTQPARASAREYYEKGKYTWNDEAQIVTLTSRKDATIKKYRINNENTLTQLSSDGTPLKTNQKNTSYVFHKNDKTQKSTGMQHGH